MLTRSLFLFLSVSLLVSAQTARRAVVTASGQGLVSVKPDQAKVSISVQTRGDTAQQAADLNAQQTNAVLNQLRQSLGQAATIATTGYSVRPEYRSVPNALPVLAGYTATNTVTVTLSDVNLVSRALDSSTQGGATTVSGVQFSLKDYNPVRAQALRQAAQLAHSNAEAIASGLGMTVGAVTAASDSFTVRSTTAPTVDARAGVAASTPTPVELGTIDVTATVTIEAELR